MTGRLGIVGGSALYPSALLGDTQPIEVETPYGDPSSPLEIGRFRETRVAFIARHGVDHEMPAHAVNHRANLWALKEAGVDEIIATSSVGSLKEEIAPGWIVVPEDYFSPWEIPTFHEDSMVHVTPLLDLHLRKGLVKAARSTDAQVKDGGVYVQTTGPRLETRTEIAMLRNFGDVLGMTMASEATLARELEIPYASLCTVDNYCNGLVEEELTYDGIRAAQGEKREVLAAMLKTLLGARH